jgi:hypothetical protein
MKASSFVPDGRWEAIDVRVPLPPVQKLKLQHPTLDGAPLAMQRRPPVH